MISSILKPYYLNRVANKGTICLFVRSYSVLWTRTIPRASGARCIVVTHSALYNNRTDTG